MRGRARDVAAGLAVAAGILALAYVAERIGTPWHLLALAAAGAVAAYGATLGRRDPIVPGVATLVLAWPLVPAFLAAIPGPPAWLPLLGDARRHEILLAVAIGVLLLGAVAGRRRA